MAQTKNDRRQIIVPQSQWNKVLALAASRHSSASAQVREALDDYFNKRSLEAKKLAQLNRQLTAR